MSRNLSGKEAMRIMVEAIGDEIGPRRLSQFEYKVRARMAKDHPIGGSFHDWLMAMAHVIVEADDSRADKGFQKGVRRIREMAANHA